MNIYQNIKDLLESLDIPYETIEHPNVKTCADSAKYRAEHGWIGAGSKNILFHAKGKFYLVVTIAEKDIKARRFKKEFGTKNIRFANAEELDKVTGCQSGSIPPFGHLNEELPIYVDNDIFEQDYFMFNPADPTKSIKLTTSDLKKIYKHIPNRVVIFKTSDNNFTFEKL